MSFRKSQATPMFALLIAACVLQSSGINTNAATILGNATPLIELQNGATITAGDMLFSQFSYSRIGDMPSSSAIDVFPIQDDSGRFGLRFQGVFQDLLTSGASSSTLRYHLASADERYVVTGANLEGVPVGYQNSFIAVDQTFLDSEAINSIHAGFGAAVPADSSIFGTPVTALTVTTDMFASSNPVAGSEEIVALAYIDQTYLQSLLETPSDAGDFDGDGFVDGADLLVWQREFGSHANSVADADGSGSVDASDLAVWQQRFGDGGGSPSATGKIPEPTACISTVSAVAAILGIRSTRRQRKPARK